MRFLTGDPELRELSKDAGIISIMPSAACVAATEEDVLEAIADARARRLSVTPRGGGTSIPSQAVGSGLVLLQDRRGVAHVSGTVRCGPSVVKDDLNRELDQAGVWVPPDPSSYRTCTVGGMVSNNSSGTRTLKYGSTLDYVRELRVVLPEEGAKTVRPMSIDEALSGDDSTRAAARLILDNQKEIEEEKPAVTKNSCGYRLEKVVHDGMFDLPRLFVGSEGTLAVFTDITLVTPAKPASRALVVVETSLRELDRVASLFRQTRPSAVELVDKSIFAQTNKEERLRTLSRTDEQFLVFGEYDGTAEEVRSELEDVSISPISGFDPLAVTDPGAVGAAWDVRNETLTLAMDVKKGSRVFVPGLEDVVVPPEKLGEIVSFLTSLFEKNGLEFISYGHAGDANLHVRPLLDLRSGRERAVLEEMMDECFETVWAMKGSITGEHGDGMLRARYVERQYPKTYSVMEQIKRTYDPIGILNPGVKIA